MKFDADMLDDLIRLAGEDGTLALLTQEELRELNDFMDGWAQGNLTKAGHVGHVGSPDWYRFKRAKFIEIMQRRPEL